MSVLKHKSFVMCNNQGLMDAELFSRRFNLPKYKFHSSTAPKASILDLLQSRGAVGGECGGNYILAPFQSSGHEAGLRGSQDFLLHQSALLSINQLDDRTA